ncbi:MAG: hypothetical protein JSS07_03450 [Proteobacteria bacterium]|nr:hypothetical protein [Pseudomonadota bacterium]
MSKSPDIAKLQNYLDESQDDRFLLSQVKSTIENISTINDVFFKNKAFLPLLREAQQKGQPTFNTLTTQIETQCGIQLPHFRAKPKP